MFQKLLFTSALEARLEAAVKLGCDLQGLKALYPPEGGKGSIQLVASDLSRLEPEEFLNDTVIDYFIKCALFFQSLESLVHKQELVALCSHVPHSLSAMLKF